MRHGLRSTRGRAAKGEASSHHEATSSPIRPTQAGPSIQPAPTA